MLQMVALTLVAPSPTGRDLTSKSARKASILGGGNVVSVLLQGGCPCDAVRFQITEVFDTGYCRCNRCREQTGAPVSAFVVVPRAAVTLLTGELVAEPWERLGQGMICESCRGKVCFDMGDRNLVSIGIGRLDEPARVRPTFHQCVSSKLPWLEIDDSLPRFGENTISHPKERESPIVADPGSFEQATGGNLV